MRVNVPAGTMARGGVQQVFFYVFETRRSTYPCRLPAPWRAAELFLFQHARSALADDRLRSVR
jgi:hypothetical protein